MALHIFSVFFFVGFSFAMPMSSTSHLLCSVEGDLPPVNLQAEWRKEEHCKDLEGNMYSVGESLKSCCDCLLYTCITEERDKCTYCKWNETTNEKHACCVDCNGVVFPPGEVMNTTQLDDNCSSIQTDRCEENPKVGVFVNQIIIPTNCCVNSTGLQPLNSSSLVPTICSSQTCSKTTRHPTAFWLVQKEHQGCDCCVYNGTLVPDGWSIPRNRFQNLTCCKGELLETALPSLSECQIQNLTYLMDTSGSMHSFRSTWEPVALELLDVMETRQIGVVDFTLLDYVTTVHVITTTSSNAVFYNAVDNLTISGGSKEHTFAGLLTALEMSNCHNFICVFTDEIGDDTNNPLLKEEILLRKSLSKSEIFFMVLPSSETPLATFQGIFADIGHVIDITNNIDAVKDVVDIMKASGICNEDCAQGPTEIIRPRTLQSEPSPWITILRRGQYGNPAAMFSDATFSEYVAGFGDENEEFWLGLQKLAKMTNSSSWELRVELVDFEENTYLAEYSSFKVEGAEKNFRLTVIGFKNKSSLQDSLSYHNGMGFSAKDKDNDDFKGNCSQPHGGWWHNSCFQSNLFGNNWNTKKSNMNGIVWRNDENVADQGLGFSWPYAEMKIRKSG